MGRSTIHSPYMEFAKLRSTARFNLATSGVMSYPLAELPVQLDRMEINGPTFYGLPVNEELVTLARKPSVVCEEVKVEKAGEIHPLFGGNQVDWSMV